MLLWTSSFALLSAQNTSLTNSQVAELYKIVKQNDYLKDRLGKTEKTLSSLERLTGEQKQIITKQDDLIKKTESLLSGAKAETTLLLESKDIEIDRLNAVLSETEKQIKRTGRKQLWKGIKIGGISVGVLGTAAALYLISK